LRPLPHVPVSALIVALLAAPSPAAGHPLGNFSIDHYSRLRVTRNTVTLRYILDLAEIPAAGERHDIDANGDRVLSAAEQQEYLARKTMELVQRLSLHVNGRAVAWSIESRDLTLVPPADPTKAGSPSVFRIVLEMRTSIGSSLAAENSITYHDANYPQRTGWKEIIVTADGPVRVHRSSAPTCDLSRELTLYPSDLSAPPQDVSADVTFTLPLAARALNVISDHMDASTLWMLIAAAMIGTLVRSRRHSAGWFVGSRL
jgi:hypothetical protein